MKRAFIRLFGCVLSAIGLSMSYDTTFTMLLDDESAPGVAWAEVATESGGSGSGSSSVSGALTQTSACTSGYSASGCEINHTAASSGWDVTGTCDKDGHRMQYFVKFITGWYVGWPNYEGGGLSTATSGGTMGVYAWPYPTDADLATNFDIYFTANSEVTSGQTFSMSGQYLEIRYDEDQGEVFDLCSGIRDVPCSFTDMSGNCVNSKGLFYGTCIANITTNYGGIAGATDDLGTRQYGPIYRVGASAFQKFGCGLASADGKCDSSYKCCYGPATAVYTVTGCGSFHNHNDDSWVCGSITTQRVAQPIVFYQYSGCVEQWYPDTLITGSDGSFGMDGFGELGPYQYKSDGTIDACPGRDVSHLTAQPNPFETLGTVYTFGWDVCQMCSDMDSISNSSSFSPSITSVGTVTYLPSSAVNTCRASVKGNKDASGTFDIIGTCTY